MALPLEDYALIGDTQTAALVGRGGSIDWMCLPRFDSEACFAALLGHREHGRWLLTPRGSLRRQRRRYLPGSLVLETEIETAEGRARVLDFMPPRSGPVDVVRIARCDAGRVGFVCDCAIRCGYGRIRPWVRATPGGHVLVAGPDAFQLSTRVPLRAEGPDVRGEFVLEAGQDAGFVLAWHPSHLESPAPQAHGEALLDTLAYWASWQQDFRYRGAWAAEVRSSITVLKALTYGPTGGIIAAPTTSLPEHLGGPRNWDYRFCWLRDATFTLYALMICGFEQEAQAWRDWLVRTVAGDPAQLQVLYGAAGERELGERELSWLPGYEGSRPVRVGNGAVGQLQLDVHGEVLDCMHQARKSKLPFEPFSWELEHALLRYLEQAWQQADQGVWEVRGPRRHFTHSKVMAWVAFDRGVKAVERFGLQGPAERWRQLRARIHEEVCREAWNPQLQSFTQFYGSSALDAAQLLIPLMGFLPASDPRVVGTLAAIQRELSEDGLLLRYRTREVDDGLPPGEGTFLACSFWLVDNLALQGRQEEARALFERLLGLRNDVGLLAEQYDVVSRRQLGNFPHVFSHVSLVNSALNLTRVAATGTQRPAIRARGG